jgi:hypothetical protein
MAVKLQYPDMQSAVESDLGQLRALFALFKRMDGSIDPTEMIVEIGDRLREELDYEPRGQADGASMAASSPVAMTSACPSPCRHCRPAACSA